MLLPEKKYNSHKIEDKWYSYWLKKGFFRAEGKSSSRPFSVVIPPPNITGSLHMGHALNTTLQDIVIRYKRMDGFNVLWLPGTDHAGIAAQMVVERQLKERGLKRTEIGRKRFIAEVWKWKEKSGSTILKQLRKLGASCDWERERFTLDQGLSHAVQEVFIRLYAEGLIYKGDYIINWCPRCRTALSDLEVEYAEENGRLYYIKYPLLEIGRGGKRSSEGDNSSLPYLVIATTRPETMLGDTAVAVNPNDKRYQGFIGREAVLPLLQRRLPVIADDYVDIAFGSGALKITPAHDPYDFEVAKRHNLPRIKVMDEQALINEKGGQYQGQDRFECRKKILEDLKKGGFLLKEEDHLHAVGECYRCRTVVEPIISRQWFIRTKPLAGPAIAAVKRGEIKIIPEAWEKTYFEWMNNIRDWCISRQIWWGHQIPAWTCNNCQEIIVSGNTPQECPSCKAKELIPETDVLDTWFSSALWPFSTLGWPEETEDLKNFYPTSVLITGFDIIFFWVARMIMFGLKFRQKVPFQAVYIHALVRDSRGQKMSKSKGNIIDPLIMLDKYGTDAFRFTLAAFAVQGRDIYLAEDRISGYRNFANKIWNAVRFLLLNLNEGQGLRGKGQEIEDIKESLSVARCPLPAASLELVDRWILSRLQKIIDKTRQALDAYKFNLAASAIYQFLWHEFCDWYLELVKKRLLSPCKKEKEIALWVLNSVLETALRLLHPFMPFITEELWQSLPHQGESIMKASYPVCRQELIDEKAEEEMGLIIKLIEKIRSVRGELGIPPQWKIDIFLQVKNQFKSELLKKEAQHIMLLSKINRLTLDKEYPDPDKRMAILIDEDIEAFMVNDLDLDWFGTHEKKISKEIKKIEEKVAFLGKKLSNQNFKERAPEIYKQKEEERDQCLLEKKKLQLHLAYMKARISA